MGTWQELSEAHRAASPLDAAADKVLSEGRALIAALAERGGVDRVEHVNRLSEDDLRSIAWAAAAR